MVSGIQIQKYNLIEFILQFSHKNTWLPFPLLVLKALKGVTIHTTWLQSPSSHPTARCGTRLSPSRISKWSACWLVSSWSERSRRSSALVQRMWANLKGPTELMGTSSLVPDCWLCSTHPDCINFRPSQNGTSETIIISFWGVIARIFSSYIFCFQLTF